MKPNRVVSPTPQGDPPETVTWRGDRFRFLGTNIREQAAVRGVRKLRTGNIPGDREPTRAILVRFDPPLQKFAGETKWGVYTEPDPGVF